MKTVIIVDDAATMRMLIEMNLRAVPDIRVLQAKTGREALELKARESPALIITDLNMPECGGYELVEQIRVVQQDRLTAIIVVTTRSGIEDARKVMRLGANAFVTKPIVGQVLVDTVTRLLG